MRVIRKNTYEEASMACAELIASQIRLKPDCKIGLATGSTPVGTYKISQRLHRLTLTSTEDLAVTMISHTDIL